ncbi:MAG: glyoxalase [Bacteroidetes bacterium HGW-Bacteroidetes-21]|nr:MAG: glyoxalase [Bacteroidetes bacterium HGW-Bacteroidetes-21]
MAKVTGIGGIFFKCKDPEKLKDWYQKNLGLNIDAYGARFDWFETADSTRNGSTQWSVFSEKNGYFSPSTKDFMINYRVENLSGMVEQFKKDSVIMLDTIETYDYGKFLHILDLEGNKVELWEPNFDFSNSQ